MGIRSKNRWIVDHSYDEFQPNYEFGKPKDEVDEIILATTRKASLVYETQEEMRLRKRSHIVVYITMVNICIGFSIVISGIFPYLKMLERNDHLSKTYLGWVIAANPLGLIFAAPVFGNLINRLGSIRQISYVATLMFAVANIFYGALPSFMDLWPHSAYHVMLFSRTIVGLSSGLFVICRTYLASATTVQERTRSFSIMSACQSLGYIIGPTIQMVLTLLIEDEMMKYQATGYISAAMGFINFVIMTPYFFQEFDIAAKERDKIKKISDTNNGKEDDMKPDVPALIGVMTTFFVGSLIYILLETLLEPLVQDQYAWCDHLAVVVVGVILTATGVLFLITFLIVPFIVKMFDERKLLIFGGAGFSVIGLLILQPMGSTQLKYCSQAEISIFKLSENSSSDGLVEYVSDLAHTLQRLPAFHRDNNTFVNTLFDSFCPDNHECLGCPPQQSWCLDVAQLPLSQVIIGFAIVLSMFPINVSIGSALFSKMLGNLPQGTWMGWLSAIGSLARILGPVYVSYVYTYLGTRYTFAILALVMLAGGGIICYFYKRIVPLTSTNKVGNKI